MTRAPHTEIEALVDAQGREWARLMFDEHMALRAATERRIEVRGADGVDRSSARDSGRQLEALVGRVEVPRLAYQAPGSEDLHPLDASLKLPRELFSHGIRRMVAKEVARASFDEVVEIVHDYSGATIAKRQVEELAVRAAQDFDAFYEQRTPEHAPTAELLILSTDGKGIVMRHEDRMDRTGARWSLTGAEAILRLRAIRSSGDFDAYWEFHLARDYERNNLTRYADATPPDPMPAPKPRLKRVK